MAKDSDGKYIGANGTRWDDQGSAANSFAAAKGRAEMANAYGMVASKMLFIGLGVAILGWLLLFAVVGFRMTWLLVQVFWLYPAVLGLAIILTIVISILKKKIVFLRFVPGFLFFILVLGIGIWQTTVYYRNSEMIFKTMYSADYIQALPDGSAPLLHQNRHQKGELLGKLGIDERVIVNGISVDYREYNITRSCGTTGWVVSDAFPDNAREMLGIAMDLGGFEQEQIQTDRTVERLMGKYMEAVPIRWTVGRGQVLEYGYEISESTLNRSIRVNAQTPLLYLSSAEYKDGGTLRETGVNVTLANILYAEDATLIYITQPYHRLNDRNLMPHSGLGGNTNEWRNGLIVTDLVTGQVYRALQADYDKTARHISGTGGQQSMETVVYFFPPFRTRHFSLTREVLPMPPPDQIVQGYGGLIGLVNNLFSGNWGRSSGAVPYIHWEFPEVRVR